MAARTVSERENWDGRRDQQRQNSKRTTRMSLSSGLARDPYHTLLENQPVENARPPGRLVDQRRAERSSFHPSLERDSFTDSSATKRLSSRVDTNSISHDIVRHSHRLSISSNASSSRLQTSVLTRLSKSSRTTPNTSVHVSRVHKPQLFPSIQPIPLSQTSDNNSDVIDLTLDDTEDERSVSDQLVRNSTRFRNQRADPGPTRRRRSPSESSSLMAPEESLFTPPPPPRKRPRLYISYLVAPPFPKGLTKADYRPMSEYLDMPLLPSSVSIHTPRPESPVIEQQTRSSKGKERELSVPCPPAQDKQSTPPNAAAEADLCVALDVLDELTVIAVEDDGTYPPLTPLDLRINTRFYFMHAWRANTSRLHVDGPDWPLKMLGKSSVWGIPVVPPAPRLPGTTGYVTSEQLRSWELVTPEGSLSEKQSKDGSEEQTPQTESHTIDADHLPLPDGSLPVPNVTDPPSSNATTSQGLLSTAVDIVHDMNQYFAGLGDSPHKQLPLRQQLGPTHTFRPHLLQSVGHSRMNPFGLDFLPLDLDPRLADAGGNECFLGVPPSPTTEDIGPSVATQSTGSPFQSAGYFPASSSNSWAFEQGDAPLPDNDSPPNDQVSPTISGTIDPSLLGLGQLPQTSPVTHKDTTPKKRSKLPEPIIYVRRPMDPSSLPLLSGKRSVQIKYRDAEGSSVTPSTRARSNEVPSNAVDNPAEASTNDGDDLPRVKRRSLPARKVVEAQAASESDSDYLPEASTSKGNNTNKSKSKRPCGKDKEPVSDNDDQETETVPTKTYCHQCRNKTARPKMMCSNVTNVGNVCGKRFCNRCILYRYPDITFDEHSAGFLCPVCTNTCNCSYCSRNRGEEFVSMRLGGVAASLFTAKVTLVRDAGGGKQPSRVKSPPRQEPPVQPSTSTNANRTTTPTPEPGPSAMPTQSQFWAHVYGMEGERMGSAFVTREHMARLRAEGETASVPKSGAEKKTKTRRKKTRTGPRVFIGEPRPSWKVRAVRDLEPSLVDVAEASAMAARRRRYYIGDLAALHEPYGRMPGATTSASRSQSLTMTLPVSPMLNSDRSLTPLASDREGDGDSGYWPQPAVGEHCSWAPGMMVVSGNLSGPGVPDVMDVDGPGAGLDLGLSLDVTVGAGATRASSGSSVASMDVDVDSITNGDGREPAPRALSEEDVARAINAALAAVSVNPPP